MHLSMFERRDHQRPAAGVSDFVKQHYNAVPERGRQWRKTDSKIRGLHLCVLEQLFGDKFARQNLRIEGDCR